jgi:superfamily I DNA/RNA helicase
MTRAKQRLYLTRARRRRVYGTLEERAPSPLMLEIGNRWLKDESPRARRPKRPNSQMALF